ncbi:MAG: hypothetical protein AAGI91_00880 [Bacteroidota bacterium]
MKKLPDSMQTHFGSDASPFEERVPEEPSGVEPTPVVPEPAETEKEAAPSKPKAERRRRSASAPVLGVYVTPDAVHGILVREAGDRYGVLRPFTRQRSVFDGEVPDLAGITPEGEAGAADDDITVQFGDASAGLDPQDLFLDSEFSDLKGIEAPDADFQAQSPKKQTTPVVFELKDILDECEASGHERPPTAFCLSQPDVEYVELVLAKEKKEQPEKEKKGKKKKAAAKEEETAASASPDFPVVKRDKLLARLEEAYESPFEKERAAFLPMTPRDGLQRFLAVVPSPEESLAESLELLREQTGMRSVPFRAIDAEVPILVGLTRWAFAIEPHENTAIVRVGTEDTLVILLQGDTLHHVEHMRNVSTFDGPDTICSRVLLQQDVQGVGTVHNVVVLSGERESELVQGFGAFYPDAQVGALRGGLVERGVAPPGAEVGLLAQTVPAIGMALRTIMERKKDSPFYEVNMLPKRLRKRRRKLNVSVAWHTLVAGVLLFFSVLFFVGLYFSQQGELAEVQARVDAYPDEIDLSGPALQAQIDSLQNAYLRINSTLNTIDSLLVGSDKWSRGLARLSSASASSGGVWVTSATPSPLGLQLAGSATSRNQVVQFAERMEGSIEELAFSQIREYPVYTFALETIVQEELPEVARYLREQAQVSDADQQPLEPEGGDPLRDYDVDSASAGS